MEQFVIISGCSGGGKSTLLAELGRRGHAVVQEPGRRIVREKLQNGGLALPWIDAAAFARQAIAMALDDFALMAGGQGWVFFDRGLIDAAAGFQHVCGEPVLAALGRSYRYNRKVFLTPPWPEIYVNDPERRHGLAAATAEYDRLLEVYPALGYQVLILPKVSVAERADLVERAVAD